LEDFEVLAQLLGITQLVIVFCSVACSFWRLPITVNHDERYSLNTRTWCMAQIVTTKKQVLLFCLCRTLEPAATEQANMTFLFFPSMIKQPKRGARVDFSPKTKEKTWKVFSFSCRLFSFLCLDERNEQ